MSTAQIAPAPSGPSRLGAPATRGRARLARLAFWFCLALYAATRLWRLAAYCLDGDEIFSLLVARHDWAHLFRFAANDTVHPPLFYVLLKVWVFFGGEALGWLRLLPAILSLSAILPFYLLCREVRLRAWETNLAVALLAVNAYTIYYGQHLRMYALLETLGFCSLWLFVRYLKRGDARSLAALAAANVLLVYAHYYGGLLIATELAVALFAARRRLARLAAATLTGGLLFVPWALTAYQAAAAKGGLKSNLVWIQRPVLNDLLWFYVDLTGTREPMRYAIRGCAVFLAVAALYLLRRRVPSPLRWLGTAATLPVLMSFAASWILPQSVWGQRHLAFVAGPFLILIAAAVHRLPWRWLRRAAVALALVAVLAQTRSAAMRKGTKLAWDRLVGEMLFNEESGAPGLHVHSVGDYLDYSVWFYLETYKAGKFELLSFPVDSPTLRARLRSRAELFAMPDRTLLGSLPLEHAWVVFSDATWPYARPPESALEEHGVVCGRGFTSKDHYQQITLAPVWPLGKMPPGTTETVSVDQ